MPCGGRDRDCKVTEQGTRVVEATSTTIVIYDVFQLKVGVIHT